MKEANMFVMNLGKRLLQEYEDIKPVLKVDHVYGSSDVARICKLTSNVTLYIYETDRIKHLTEEDKKMIEKVSQINEFVDCALTGRVPFQAIRPDENENDF